MKNKIICLLLAMIMCVACLAGCNGGGDDSGDSGASNGGDNTNNGGNTDNGGNGDGTGDGGNVDDGNDDGNWWDNINYDETTLIFQMTNCTNRQELPSGCQRYLAGVNDKGQPVGNEPVDELVRSRNDDAYENTNVNVNYLYYPDTYEQYGYSFARNAIANTIDTSSKENCPDIFCNWMTDMLLCSLKGYFANVMTQESQYGHNYFNINLSLDGEQNQFGYMSDLMRSLTLNQGQVYVIASDYFIDLIRAFFVVPVNVNLFNTAISNGKLQPALSDLTKDGKVDIDDFFKEVDNGDWTYDRLVDYSEAIYTPAAGTNTENCNDTLGFALGKNGLPAAGMIYTSSAVVIQRTVENGKTVYTYPSTPTQEFQDVIKGIDNMVGYDGVYVMTADDAGTLGLQGDEKTALLGVRKKFTTNSLLFGGVILVGSLEYTDYQNMSKDGGFGVVPVPVYKKGDSYLTQIHVVGRAGAITAKTEKFSQCSAFLQYQTMNSTEVLDYYYEYNLSYGTAGGVAGNVAMLAYIRNHVRTSFDKLFEDAIGFFYQGSGIDDSDRYHTLLTEYYYQFADEFTGEYRGTVEIKKSNLKSLEGEYEKLPK